MQPTVLEHPRFRVIPRPSNKLVVFFSGSTTPDHVFRWWKAAQRTEASAILVNNGPNEWYQRGIEGLGGSVDEVVDTIRKWADHLGATRLYTVGTSMGGAGALLYGAKLGANVLAFAAETRLDFPHGNVRRLMSKEFTPEYPDLRPLVESAAGYITLISGESEPVDLVSAASLTGIPRVNVVSLKKVTHGPPNYLKARKRLIPLVDAFLADQRLPDFEEEGMGAHTKGFPEALYAAYCSDREKRHTDTAKHAAEALSLYPESELAMALLGKSLMLQGRATVALPLLRDATRLHSKAENRFLYGTCLLKVGRRSDAATTFKKMIEKYPDNAEGYYGLASVYADAASYKSAVSMMKKAIKHAPHRISFNKKLDQYMSLLTQS
ncbi:tetratricopeptide repeat protein [Brevundimonas diminuta]|uniref:tetratricopeptide repeat protein n=1 Tax=Brevundimonas diminuta TaxID=293 RepID=UPI00320857A6